MFIGGFFCWVCASLCRYSSIFDRTERVWRLWCELVQDLGGKAPVAGRSATRRAAAQTMRRAGRRMGTDWKPVVLYGALLAAGTVALQWIDYQRLARAHSDPLYTFLIAGGFL